MRRCPGSCGPPSLRSSPTWRRSASTASRSWPARCVLFGRFGFSEGVAGHITARDPELTDHFWVNPFAMSFRHVRVSDLILVSHTGEVVEGDRPVNPAAFAIHSAVHAARPDVIAAAHAHSVYGKAWSALGRPLDPITQDACVFFEDHTVCEEGGGAVVHRGGCRQGVGGSARPAQGDHPPEPRAVHRRPDGRRGGVVVHHHGALLPGPAAGRGGGDAAPHRRRGCPLHARSSPPRRTRDGCRSSRCGTRSAGAIPTCSTDRHRQHVHPSKRHIRTYACDSAPRPSLGIADFRRPAN